MNKYISGVVFSGLLFGSPVSVAASAGGFTFDDNAYVDALLGSSGSFTTSGGTLADVLTDTDAATFAFSDTNNPNAYVNLGFTDNLLINGIGADLVLFELGNLDSLRLSLSLGETTITYITTWTGDTVGGQNLNAVAIDLDDFGIAPGVTFSEFFVGMDVRSADGKTRPSLSLAAALNSTAVSGEDSDGDGILDTDDNCIQHDNPDQLDTDGDGYGNLCDGDLNNDGSTNTLDLNLYKAAHRTAVGDANYDVDADFNGDGLINTLDLNTYKGLHRLDPGPSCCGLF